MTIDWWTLGLQTVNVAILIWLLGKFFWRPVAGMIEDRRAAAQTLLADAEHNRQEAATALAQIVQTRAGLGQERDAILAAAQATADQAHTARLAQAERDAAALVAASRVAMAKEQAAASEAWPERSNHLAIAIAGRLAARLDGSAIRGAFLNWLLAAIQALPTAARQAAAGQSLDAVSAAPLPPAEQEQHRNAIAAAFGVLPRITFKVDPELIAGLELQGPHFTLRNSWQADLARIHAGLGHDAER